MLKKLIKHEFKSTYKICVIFLATVGFITLLNTILFHTPVWRDMSDGGVQDSPLILIGLFMVVINVFSLMAIIYAVLIFVGVQFYRSMYTSQGYLTHTIPVNSHRLIISKLLTGTIWYLAAIALIILSVLMFIFTMASLAEVSMWGKIGPALRIVREEFKNAFGFPMGGYLTVVLIAGIMNAFAAVMRLFGAITIGQLSSRYKVFMSIITYVGISVVQWLITYMVTVSMLIRTTNTLSTNRYNSLSIVNFPSLYSFIPTTIISVALAVGLYFLSNYIISKKLNLE